MRLLRVFREKSEIKFTLDKLKPNKNTLLFLTLELLSEPKTNDDS